MPPERRAGQGTGRPTRHGDLNLARSVQPLSGADARPATEGGPPAAFCEAPPVLRQHEDSDGVTHRPPATVTLGHRTPRLSYGGGSGPAATGITPSEVARAGAVVAAPPRLIIMASGWAHSGWVPVGAAALRQPRPQVAAALG
jgi:hypothetical protein